MSRTATNRGLNLDTLRTQATILTDPSSVIRGETVPDEHREPAAEEIIIRGEVEK